MSSIRPGPNTHPGMGGPPPQPYASLPPSQPRSNGYQMSSVPPSGPPPPHASPAATSPGYPSAATMKQLADANVAVWMDIGRIAESIDDFERAKTAYEMAFKHNHDNLPAKKALALLYKDKLRNNDKAIELFQSCLQHNRDQPDIWALVGACYLMNNDLPMAYSAYQSALNTLSNAQNPDVWYGIGLLYDRYASFDHAEEAFSNVLYIDPNHRKRSEIYFRLGIIYKQQKKYRQSIDCFEYILDSPPEPLTPSNVRTQIGYVYEVWRMYVEARDAFEMVLRDEPDNPKVLLQLGYIHSLPDERDRPNPIRDLDRAYGYIDRALQIDPKDPHAWYTLGRYFMQRGNYGKAYEAYQQAVYRDSRNSNFWCSIGVLYWEINQYRDALDAYTRAIRLNPYIPEIWFNLGTLYEACNNQIQDAIDAYNRAYELDNNYHLVEQRLRYLKSVLETGRNDNSAPPRPEDIDPQRYEDFVQGQQNSLQLSQLNHMGGPITNQWGPNANAGPASSAPPPPIAQRSMHPQQPPQQPPYPPRRSPDQMKGTPYSHPHQTYPNGGSSYGRSGPAPPVTVKRGSSPPPPPSYGYDSRPPIGDPSHQGHQRHDDMVHRPPPIHQGYSSPRQHDRDIGGPVGMGGSSFPPVASRSPISTYNRPRSPPPFAVSQQGPPPDVKPLMDQGPPISPGGAHNIQLAPLQSVRSPPTNIPPVPRNDAAPYPPMSEPPKRWEPEPRDYPRLELSRTSPRPRPEERLPSQDRLEERRPSPAPPPPPSHEPAPRPRSPLISPRTTEPSYIPGPPPVHKSPPAGGMKMEIDSPADRADHRSVSRGNEAEKMHVEEDKRPEAEAPARVMDIDEDYDKEEESRPDEKSIKQLT